MSNRAKNTSALAILLIIYPTDTVTHAKGQIYMVIHWSIIGNSIRLEIFKMSTNLGQVPKSPYCLYGMTVKASF